MKLPDTINKLIEALSDLPSIGPRQATRLVFHLISEGKGSIADLERTIGDLKNIKICERCYFIHQNSGELCDICSNNGRDQKTILIVEKETDLISLENTGRYGGIYFILGDVPKTGLLEDWQRSRLENLKDYISGKLGGKANEIILGFNPTSVGDFHASIISKELAGCSQKVSRLGRGLPTGGEIEFADDETLGSSLERRS